MGSPVTALFYPFTVQPQEESKFCCGSNGVRVVSLPETHACLCAYVEFANAPKLVQKPVLPEILSSPLEQPIPGKPMIQRQK
jgi:hypothetical protein